MFSLLAPRCGAVRHCALAAGFVIASAISVSAQAPVTPDSARRAPADSTGSHRLGTVTVTTAPAGRDQPNASVRVDAATIRKTPARDAYDLLRQTAGLEVHEQGQGPGFASNASLRGFSSDHSTDLALWIDGVPINEPVNGHAEGYNDFSVLFPGGVSELDVVRGPASALFGNFALAGVVNVRTIERLKGTELTASGGSYGRADVMTLTGFDAGEKGGGVVGGRFFHDGGFRPHDHSDLAQLHGRVVRDLASGVTVDGGIELYGARWVSAGFLSESEFARHDYGIVSNTTDGGYKRRAQERVSLRVIRNSAVWRTTAYATQGNWQLFLTIPPAGGKLEGSGSQTEEEDARQGYGLTSAVTVEHSLGEMTVGAEGRWDAARYQNFFTTARNRDSVALIVRARQLSGALFFQSHFDFTNRFRADVGARYDDLDTRSMPGIAPGDAPLSKSHAVVSPKLGALFRFAPWLGAYSNVSRGFRSTDGVISQPSLAPITAWAYESGIKTDIGAAHASADVFQMNVSNEQTFNPLTGEASNGGSSRRRGLEVDLSAPLQRSTTLTAAWTLLDARYTSLFQADDNGSVISLNGKRVYNTASYFGSAAAEYAPGAASWSVRLAGNWVGRYSPFDEPGETVGGYGLIHLSGTVRRGETEIAVGISNFLNRAFPELIAGHLVSPGQPRAVFVTLRHRK
jgi:outer membrane receptor protein involved in Fe transport